MAFSDKVTLALMNDLHDEYCREYTQLAVELERLKEMFREVAWYNFEVLAREWKSPWYTTFMASCIELHGRSYTQQPGRTGHVHEMAKFPMYYMGTIEKAPPLPPEIVMAEVEKATKALEDCAELCAAPYEWAPGGHLYEKMLRESEGVREYRRLFSMRRKRGHGADWCRNESQLGDRLARAAEAHKEATTADVLGGVRRD